MEQTYLKKYNSEAEQLFEEIKNCLKLSSRPQIRDKAKQVPTSLYEGNPPINIVFAGQYSAGKSTLLKIITGKDLEIGGGITTQQCKSFSWQGITVTDTPGIHTQKRPDHDALTYEQIAKADLIVFVITAEGFSDHLAHHFQKLIHEKGKGHEMMLVVNKMDRTANGNTPEQQQIIFNKDILPVIHPYTGKDLWVTYVRTDTYFKMQDPKFAKYQKELLAKSGLEQFVDNLNHFVAQKGLLGRSTTALYKVEKLLSELLSEMKSGDSIVDGYIHLLNEKRRAIEEAKTRIKDKVSLAVNEQIFKIQDWGAEIANQLNSQQKQNEINQLLVKRQRDVDKVTEDLTSYVEKVLGEEAKQLKTAIDKLTETEFAQNLKLSMERRIEQVKISAQTYRKVEKASSYMRDFGTKIARMSVGKAATNGGISILKTQFYAGSQLHKSVLEIGHFFNFKFKPWQAVRWTKNIANGSRILGAAGAVLSIGLQVYNDKQEDKCEQQLAQGRSEIRSCFRDASNVIEMEYDKATDTWIQKNLNPTVKTIDDDLATINNNLQENDNQYNRLLDLLGRTRRLISDIQSLC